MFDLSRLACVLACVTLLLAMPQAGFAETAVLRAGEHGDFTRVTLSSATEIRAAAAIARAPRSFDIALSPLPSGLDATRLFDRIGTSRLASVEPSESGLRLNLNCACDIRVGSDGAQLIILDIYNTAVVAAAPAPDVPPEPTALLRTADLTTPKVGILDMDHSVVERISKTVSTQLADTFHIQGFSALAGAISDAETAPYRTAPAMPIVPIIMPDVTRVAKQDRCMWSDKIWTSLAAMPRASATSDTLADDQARVLELTQFDQPDTLFQAETVRLLADGRLIEARLAHHLGNPTMAEQQAFQHFEQMMMGTADVGAFRFGECNPFDDVLIASARSPLDVPDAVMLESMHTFANLPLGAQILLYPRLEPLFSKVSNDVFAGLARHADAETMLAARRPMEQALVGGGSDPDGLAALGLEMRGTDQEVESWRAAFQSYLEHGRYFDAVSALEADTPLSASERRDAATELTEHLVDHADSITFVQLALASIPDMDPPPSEAAQDAVTARLSADGFVQSATPVAPMRATVADTPQGTTGESAVSERTALDQGHTPQPAAHPVQEAWTLARARMRLAESKKLREELTARLSR